MGKDIKEGLNFNEFQSVMTSRMVSNYLSRAQEIPKTKYLRSLNSSMKII
jgi:hypothetical protein